METYLKTAAAREIFFASNRALFSASHQCFPASYLIWVFACCGAVNQAYLQRHSGKLECERCSLQGESEWPLLTVVVCICLVGWTESQRGTILGLELHNCASLLS